MKTQNIPNFAWQQGYGAFTLGRSDFTALIHYIEIQKQHHQKISFQDELRAILQRYEIEYDERYLWD